MVTVICEESQRCMGFPRNADAGSEVFENLEAGMPVDEITTVFDVTHEEEKPFSTLPARVSRKIPLSAEEPRRVRRQPCAADWLA